MLTGEVTNREARVELEVIGPLGSRTVSFIIDTGFTESLTLPSALVAALGCPIRTVLDMELADGSLRLVNVYDARAIWLAGELPLLVHEIEGDPLLGMMLLGGSRLTVDVVDGGAVRVEMLRE